MLLVLVELGINHVCSTRNILVGVRPTVLVLIKRMLLELRLGGGLKVLPELERHARHATLFCCDLLPFELTVL